MIIINMLVATLQIFSVKAHNFVTMGESETVLAQTSAVMEQTSASSSSTDFGNTFSGADAFADDGAGTTTTKTPGDLSASASATPDASNVGVGTYSNSSLQEAHAVTLHDSKPSYEEADACENFVGPENTVVDTSQVASPDSSINANGVGEGRNFPLAGSENGNPSDDVHGSTSVHQAPDGSGMSLCYVCSIWLPLIFLMFCTCHIYGDDYLDFLCNISFGFGLP